MTMMTTQDSNLQLHSLLLYSYFLHVAASSPGADFQIAKDKFECINNKIKTKKRQFMITETWASLGQNYYPRTIPPTHLADEPYSLCGIIEIQLLCDCRKNSHK